MEQHLAALDELSELQAAAPLAFKDKNSAERSLQILVEIAIGCSKHYLKLQGEPVPSEAHAAIERVYELMALTSPDIQNMRGAVGMHNAIVHGYLNLDWARIEPVLSERKYHKVAHFVTRVSEKLLHPEN